MTDLRPLWGEGLFYFIEKVVKNREGTFVRVKTRSARKN